jgi:hypothetical protein
MKEEDELLSPVDSTENNVQLQRKKIRLCENNYVGKCWYKQFLQKHRVPINGVILKAQEVQFNKLLSRNETVKAYDGWLYRWKVRHGICQIHIEGESIFGNSSAVEQFPEILCKMNENSEYNDEQLYNCAKTALYCKLRPKKSLHHKSTQQSRYEN